MPTAFATRPASTEFSTYFARYVGQVPEGDVLERLRMQIEDTAALFGGLTDAQASYRYAPGKWSARQIVGHMSDTERVFTYRANAFARGDTTPLPSFDQDLWMANSRFDERSMNDLVTEFRAVRASTVALFESLTDEALSRVGVASGNPTTARAIAYITAGHEIHHVRIFREEYLGQR